jgi:type IV secretion system protein VirB10
VTADTPTADPDDVRPIVHTEGASNRSVWIFGGLVLIAAALLFNALNSRREALTAATTGVLQTGGAMVSSPPPLVLPPQFRTGSAEERSGLLQPALRRPGLAPTAQPQVVTRIVERPVPVDTSPEAGLQPYNPEPSMIDAPDFRPPTAAAEMAPSNNSRVLAGRLPNPRFTVQQGTVIPAVLETALDSTRPGGVRAIVQRDVMGFDGTRVLIPRGSRLYGEYGSDVSAGQKRALIRWTRLTRPDAVIVNLDSPAADPLGRAGVEGKVNNHFFARFSSAIVQSILDIGVGVATREASRDGVIVALPGSTQNMTGTQPQQVQPTLRVRQGTSVSVFVSRDLDFSAVDS